MPDLIYCIGDSHVSFFSGYNAIIPKWTEDPDYKGKIECFKPIRVGPSTAYGLLSENTKSDGRRIMFAALKTIPEGSTVLLCFGEIDCRVHVCCQAIQQNKSYEAIVDDCLERYLKVIDEVRAMGFKVIVWNIIASVKPEIEGSDMVNGSVKDRNMATVYFNSALRKRLPEDVYFLDIFDKLLDQSRWMVRTEYYMDDVHLSYSAMPFVLDILKKEGFIE